LLEFVLAWGFKTFLYLFLNYWMVQSTTALEKHKLGFSLYPSAGGVGCWQNNIGISYLYWPVLKITEYLTSSANCSGGYILQVKVNEESI